MGLRDLKSYYSECPEPRFELVDGRFFVGNNLRGNRYVMSALLEGWGLEAAIPFALNSGCKRSAQHSRRKNRRLQPHHLMSGLRGRSKSRTTPPLSRLGPEMIACIGAFAIVCVSRCLARRIKLASGNVTTEL